MATTVFSGDISFDYHQMYLCDAGLPELPADYSDEAIARRVVAGEHALIIHVERDMPVPVQVLLHDAKPTIELTAFDHVSETGLSLPSGSAVIAGLLAYAPDAPHLPVPAGRYGVIVTFAGLDTLSEDALQGEDRYAIHLWPDQQAPWEVTVLKRHPFPG